MAFLSTGIDAIKTYKMRLLQGFPAWYISTMVMEKVERWFNALGVGWITAGIIALSSVVLAKIIHPVFYAIYLVYPFGPYFFLYGEVALFFAVVAVALLFITIGIGLQRRARWGRVGSILLAAATTLYFAATLLGLWGNYVRHGSAAFVWLVIPAILWLAVMIPSLYFLLHKESEKLFLNSLEQLPQIE